jgi:hypothetical protein
MDDFTIKIERSRGLHTRLNEGKGDALKFDVAIGTSCCAADDGIFERPLEVLESTIASISYQADRGRMGRMKLGSEMTLEIFWSRLYIA